MKMQIVAKLTCARPESVWHIAYQTIIESTTVVLVLQKIFVWLSIKHYVRIQLLTNVKCWRTMLIIDIWNAFFVKELSQAICILIRIFTQNAWRKDDCGIEPWVVSHQFVYLLISPKGYVKSHKYYIDWSVFTYQLTDQPLMLPLYSPVFPSMKPQVVQYHLYLTTLLHFACLSFSYPNRIFCRLLAMVHCFYESALLQ